MCGDGVLDLARRGLVLRGDERERERESEGGREGERKSDFAWNFLISKSKIRCHDGPVAALLPPG